MQGAEARPGARGLFPWLRSRLTGIAMARTGVMASAQTLAVNVLILGVNLGTGIMTARFLGPEGRGELAAMSMWPQLIAFLLTLGLPSSLLYNLRCHPARGDQLFSAFLLLGSAMGVVSMAAGIAIIPFWLTEYSIGVVRFAQVGMITAPVALFTAVFTSVLLARDEFGFYNLMRVIQPITCLTLLALLAMAGRLDPYSAAAVTLAAGVPWWLWMLVRFLRIYRPRWANLRWASGRLLSYGVRSYGVDLLGTLAANLDRIFVVGLLNPEQMGLYVVAIAVALTLNLLPTAVVSVLFPKSSGCPTAEVVHMTGRAVRISLTASILLAIVLGAFSPLALELLYGSEFGVASSVLRILLAEGVLRGTVWILAQAFMALGRPGLVGVLQGFGLALAVPLMLVLVPRYGLEGAGWALLISTTLRAVFILASFPLVLKQMPPRLWPGKADFADLLSRVGWGK